MEYASTTPVSEEGSRLPMVLGVVLVVFAGFYIYLYGFPNLKEYSTSTILWGVFGIVTILGILYMGFTDPLALYTFLLILTVLVFILYYFGFVKWNIQKNTLEIDLFEKPTPAPAAGPSSVPQASKMPNEPEVFYVANNIFTYDQAPAVCKAYGAELATYKQIEEAYNAGGEWCGYGWTQGGLALFPTQQGTWEQLQGETDQTKRTSCGRPGINGGYFDPMTKFGVNCYGQKPKKPIGGPEDPTNKQLSNLVKQYKDKLKSFVVAPFDKKDWYESPGISDSEGGLRDMGKDVSDDVYNPLSSGGRAPVEHMTNPGCPPDVDVYAPLATTTDLGLRGYQPKGPKLFTPYE